MPNAADKPPNTISVTHIGDVTAIRFVGMKIRDSDRIHALFEEIELLIRGQRKILVNFINIDYLSSLGLKMLLRIHKKIKKDEGRLHLCCLDPNIYDVFKIARLDKLFAIYPDEESALAEF